VGVPSGTRVSRKTIRVAIITDTHTHTHTHIASININTCTWLNTPGQILLTNRSHRAVIMAY